MTFAMRVEMDNDAFGETRAGRARELARILFEVRCRVAVERTNGAIMDANGNKVGEWSIEP